MPRPLIPSLDLSRDADAAAKQATIIDIDRQPNLGRPIPLMVVLLLLLQAKAAAAPALPGLLLLPRFHSSQRNGFRAAA